MAQPALLLFIHHPPAGDDGARTAYEAAMAHLRGITLEFTGEKFLFYTGYPNWNDAWDINVYRKRVQQGDAPGACMAAAFETALEEGYERILFISGDCDAPGVPVIEEALTTLDAADAVISSAADGGCCLLALRSPAAASLPASFAQSDGTFTQVLAAIQKGGFSCRVLNAELPNH